MPSRLKTLMGDLMVAQIENRDSFCIETDALEGLLAVVEAARKYITEFGVPVPDLSLRVRYRADLRNALAKLDEVQP